jgi:hypothetical protein
MACNTPSLTDAISWETDKLRKEAFFRCADLIEQADLSHVSTIPPTNPESFIYRQGYASAQADLAALLRAAAGDTKQEDKTS